MLVDISRIFSKPLLAKIIFILLLLISVFNILNFVVNNRELYTEIFNPAWYGKLYGQSQYVRVDPISVLPDEIVYSYAAWRYVAGDNPAIFNADQPPLGKYFIGLFEVIFQNSRVVGIFFNVIDLVALLFLARLLLKSSIWAMSTTALFSFEKLFIAQMHYAPLLDNIQLFFILLSFIFYLLSFKKKIFLLVAFVFLGGVISTKFWITGAVIFVTWVIHALWHKDLQRVVLMFMLVPLTIGVLVLVYTPSLTHGYSVKKVLSVQKYIYDFHRDKLHFEPLAVWDLLLFNRWHVPSEGVVRQSVDWQWSWPIVTVLSLLSIINVVRSGFKVLKESPGTSLLIVWFSVYMLLLFVGEVLPRYLFPVLPFMYVLSIYTIKNILLRSKL